MLHIPNGAAFLNALLVTPEELNAKALEAFGEVLQVIRDFEELDRIQKKTGYYWIGSAGDAFRAEFIKKKTQMERMVKNCQQDIEVLKQISQVYAATEQQVEAIAEELPGDILG